MSRTHAAAAFCAVLSTVAVAGMAATMVLAGNQPCDDPGCAATAAFTVTPARHTTEDRVSPPQLACTGAAATPTATTPPMADEPPAAVCAPQPQRLPVGGMATGPVPAP